MIDFQDQGYHQIMEGRGNNMALHFKSKEAYRKYKAYGYIHGIFSETKHPNDEYVYIAGKRHKIK